MLAIQTLKSQPSPFGLFMYYAIMGQDVKNSLDKRKSARTAHLDRLNELVEQKRLLVAGPHPAIDSNGPGEAGFSGSLSLLNSIAQTRLKHGLMRTLI